MATVLPDNRGDLLRAFMSSINLNNQLQNRKLAQEKHDRTLRTHVANLDLVKLNIQAKRDSIDQARETQARAGRTEAFTLATAARTNALGDRDIAIKAYTGMLKTKSNTPNLSDDFQSQLALAQKSALAEHDKYVTADLALEELTSGQALPPEQLVAEKSRRQQALIAQLRTRETNIELSPFLARLSSEALKVIQDPASKARALSLAYNANAGGEAGNVAMQELLGLMSSDGVNPLVIEEYRHWNSAVGKQQLDDMGNNERVRTMADVNNRWTEATGFGVTLKGTPQVKGFLKTKQAGLEVTGRKELTPGEGPAQTAPTQELVPLDFSTTPEQGDPALDAQLAEGRARLEALFGAQEKNGN